MYVVTSVGELLLVAEWAKEDAETRGFDALGTGEALCRLSGLPPHRGKVVAAD
jgi:hypothetical protein